MKNMLLYEKHLEHNSDVGKDTVNWQTKMQRNCDVISVGKQNVWKYDVYLTLLEISFFCKP